MKADNSTTTKLAKKILQTATLSERLTERLCAIESPLKQTHDETPALSQDLGRVSTVLQKLGYALLHDSRGRTTDLAVLKRLKGLVKEVQTQVVHLETQVDRLAKAAEPGNVSSKTKPHKAHSKRIKEVQKQAERLAQLVRSVGGLLYLEALDQHPGPQNAPYRVNDNEQPDDADADELEHDSPEFVIKSLESQRESESINKACSETTETKDNVEELPIKDVGGFSTAIQRTQSRHMDSGLKQPRHRNNRADHLLRLVQAIPVRRFQYLHGKLYSSVLESCRTQRAINHSLSCQILLERIAIIPRDWLRQPHQAHADVDPAHASVSASRDVFSRNEIHAHTVILGGSGSVIHSEQGGGGGGQGPIHDLLCFSGHMVGQIQPVFDFLTTPVRLIIH